MSFWDKLVQADYDTFAFLNGLHLPWLDEPMFLASSDWFWIPLYGFFIFLLVKRYLKKSWLPVAFIFMGVLLSDQISAKIKKTVQRPRPTHHRLFQNKVHTVNDYTGGEFGFVSSHAANTFCIAVMLVSFLYLRKLYLILVLFWAIIVTYSRIYLGVHFPADVIGGAILGVMIAVVLIIIKKRAEFHLFYKA